MRIGILTFHSQLNYGGILQCWALKEALKGFGHEVVVIDRWLDPENWSMIGGYSRFGWKDWARFCVRGVLGSGDFGLLLRRWRTWRFVRSLGLTAYHFVDWKEAPADLGVDCVVVGSDQVWHGGDWGDPGPYLLEGAPEVKAISYAASFGMRELPPGCGYDAGFRRFSAISVREAEGVRMVSETGYPRPVAHVVDPTLLLPRDVWYRLAPPASRRPLNSNRCGPRRLVCYFLSEDLRAAIPVLSEWSRRNDCRVDIIGNYTERDLPGSVRQTISRLPERLRTDRVHVGYGPVEFVRAFARADACVTDSFHAVMFSAVYDLDVRYLRPSQATRQAMVSRITEFAQSSIDGPFFSADLAAALTSLVDGPRVVFRHDVVASRRAESVNWLSSALTKMENRGVCYA